MHFQNENLGRPISENRTNVERVPSKAFFSKEFFFTIFRRKTLQLQRESSRANHQVKTRSSTASYFNFESPNEAGGEISNSEARTPTSAKSRMDVQMEAEAVHYQRPQYRSMNGNNNSVGAMLRNHTSGPLPRERHGTIKENITLTMSRLISWSEQIASGMSYLSSKKVVHGDLACR